MYIRERLPVQLSCGEVLLAYTEGMMCFACEANYQDYLDDDAKVVQLAETVTTITVTL